MTSAQVLEIFQKCGALLHGHFVLRSGKHSRDFFQCALVLQEPTATAKLCQALVEKLEKEKWTFSSVISPAMGGILVGHEVARHLGKRHIFAEKEEGKLRVRRFTVSRGERFLVAEDVVTTGSAVKEVIQLVQEAGGEVHSVLYCGYPWRHLRRRGYLPICRIFQRVSLEVGREFPAWPRPFSAFQ